MIPDERLRSAHVVGEDGQRRSGGDAAADVLSVLPSTRALGGLAHSVPRATAALYGLLATRRMSFGRLVGQDARRRADALLDDRGVRTAAQLASSRPDAGRLRTRWSG